MTDTPPVPKKKKSKKSQEKRQESYARALKTFNVQKPATASYAKNVRTMQALKDMLRQTWARHWDNTNSWSRFSEKQMNFAREYAISGRRSRVKCMRRAGYESHDDTYLLEAANRNLKVPYFEELIQAFEIEEKARMGLKVQDVADWYERIATAALDAGDFSAANRAMELYGKYLQMFCEKREIVHRVVHSKDELNMRIAELTNVLKEAEPEIESRLRLN